MARDQEGQKAADDDDRQQDLAAKEYRGGRGDSAADEDTTETVEESTPLHSCRDDAIEIPQVGKSQDSSRSSSEATTNNDETTKVHRSNEEPEEKAASFLAPKNDSELHDQQQQQQQDFVPVRPPPGVVVDSHSLLPRFKDQVRPQQRALVGKKEDRNHGNNEKLSEGPQVVHQPRFKDQADDRLGVNNHAVQQQQQQRPGDRDINVQLQSPVVDDQQEGNNQAVQRQRQQQPQRGRDLNVGLQTPIAVRVDSAVLEANVVPSQDEEAPDRRGRNIRLMLLVMLLLVGVFVGAFCGSGSCGRSSPSAVSTKDPDPPIPPNATIGPDFPISTAVPKQTRSDAITAYINNITLSGREIFYSVRERFPTPEERALEWLIDFDSLQLMAGTAVDQFRLRQRYALASLYFQSTEPWSNSSNWLDSEECGWYGVICEQEDLGGDTGLQNVVSGIDLCNPYGSGNNVHGSIPADLGLLSSLTYFDVGDNELAGSLPDSIKLWTHLTHFSVWYNVHLNGTLPTWIGQRWKNMTFFHVGTNSFSGTIPDSIGQWTSLTRFQAYSNAFTGTLPLSIGQWASLTHFDIHWNSLKGTLPNSIGQWRNLTYFNIRSNFGFTGTIPDSFANWTGLTHFDASGGLNALSGTLPGFIGQWSRLLTFNIHSNDFRGMLPNSIGQWSSLLKFDVGDNSFSGTIPNSIVNWRQVYHAHFGRNAFGGTMPFCNPSNFYLRQITLLYADCTEVDCTCCSYCCDIICRWNPR